MASFLRSRSVSGTGRWAPPLPPKKSRYWTSSRHHNSCCSWPQLSCPAQSDLPVVKFNYFMSLIFWTLLIPIYPFALFIMQFVNACIATQWACVSFKNYEASYLIYWKVRGRWQYLAKVEDRISYQTCFKVISWKLFFLISKLTNVVLTLYRSFGKRYWKVAISILRKSII